MRSYLFKGWILLPAVLAVVHFGPGQHWLQQGDASALANAARVSAQQERWEDAAAEYQAALAALPESTLTKTAQRERLDLEVALGRALVMSGAMIEGQERLERTLQELETTGPTNASTAIAARAELATSNYYAAWIMRLEGATAEEWKAEAELARQHFRLLAERAGDAEGAFQRNLEATIRLEQMDLSELLARPLPKNCPNCKQGLCQKKRQQCAGRCNADGKGKQEQQNTAKKDAREEIKKSNSAGLNSGSRIGS